VPTALPSVNDLDARKIRVSIQFRPHRFEGGKIRGGKRIETTVVKLFKVQFILNADRIEGNTVSILKAAQIGCCAARELRQGAGRPGSSQRRVVELRPHCTRGVENSAGKVA
jgi:hypothetical protein